MSRVVRKQLRLARKCCLFIDDTGRKQEKQSVHQRCVTGYVMVSQVGDEMTLFNGARTDRLRTGRILHCQGV